jgi:hypothetical protein
MNKAIPLWHTQYKNHIHEWNSSFIKNSEPMKIQFIPKNNKYTVEDHLNILKKLKDILINHNPDYSINLIQRPEGGFQLHNKKYIKSYIHSDSDLQILSNINKTTSRYFLESKNNKYIELMPYTSTYNKSGIKIFEFTGYMNVPKKVMLYLYAILQNMDMLIHTTENFPDLNDVVWEHKTIWEDVYLYNPVK